MRRSVEESWQWLEQNGYEAPRLPDGGPFIPQQMPSTDDEELALRFFRTLLEDEALADLTIPRTYVGRSGFTRVSFHNTDLHESRMCWNDFIQCDFTDADLSGCDMRSSSWESCSFVRCNLSDADLRGADLDRCDFTGASLAGAKLTRLGGARLALDPRQRSEIEWHWLAGPEPPGG